MNRKLADTTKFLPDTGGAIRNQKELVLEHGTYLLQLLNGNHGIWAFVLHNGKTIMEQSLGGEDEEKAFKWCEVEAIEHHHRHYLMLQPDFTKSKWHRG